MSWAESSVPWKRAIRSARLPTLPISFSAQVDAGERVIVGVNRHTKPDEGDGIPTLKIEHAVEEGQVARTKAFKAARDASVVAARLADVQAALRDDKQNVMPPIIAAVKVGCTVGEICDLFRSELGEYRDPAYL
jgi:methylmalonyl-CoA mutase N-terminal domain/subunit